MASNLFLKVVASETKFKPKEGDSVKMSVLRTRSAHFQESGFQKDLPKAMKAQSTTKTRF